MRDGQVVKGVRFQDHRVVGDILELAQRYCQEGADELVFYDISASPRGERVSRRWVSAVAAVLDIPFSVAGGIRSVADAEQVLAAGAEKISINSPALDDPALITELAQRFGSQCVVVGMDSCWHAPINDYGLWRNAGDPSQSAFAQRKTLEWVREVIARGAGEVVLNCMHSDGVRQGYDVAQLRVVRAQCTVPLIASGGAGRCGDFSAVFLNAGVDGALAASVFHSGQIRIADVKSELQQQGIEVRV